MSEIVPHSRPTLGAAEHEAVTTVLESGQLAQGTEVRALEEEVAALLDGRGCVAVGSGTQALLGGLLGLGIGPGSRVGIPAFTCAAVLYAVEWSGAEPVLLDNGERDIAPDAASLDAAGDLDAVVLVHPWGYPLDTAPYRRAAALLVEDCAQSIGARFGGEPVGLKGDATIFSFYATKMLCAGEGGLVAAGDPATVERIRDLRDYDGKPDHARRFNLKMSDLHAALARVQVARLPEFLDGRRTIAVRYDEELAGLKLEPVRPPPSATASWYRYLCWFPVPVGPVIEHCDAAGVHCRRPVPVTLDRLSGGPTCPNAAFAWDHLLSLPIYPTLTEVEQSRVFEALAAALESWGKEGRP